MKTLMFHSKFISSLFLYLLLIVMPQQASAQMDSRKAYFKGKGSNISEVENLGEASSTTATRILLYNMGKDMFLNAGGYWGTRTATFTVGLPLVLNSTDNRKTFNIHGPFTNDTGDAVGLMLGEQVDNRNGVYFDRDQNNQNSKWTFKEIKKSDDPENITDEDGTVYQITTTASDGKTYTLCSNQRMIINVYNEQYVNTNLVKALTDSDMENIKADKESRKNTYWKIVTEDGMQSQFDNTYNNEAPADATYLMRAQGFNRNNIFIHGGDDSETYDKGWNHTGTLTYNTKFNNEFGADYVESDIESVFGMFHCAKINGAKAKAKLYQTVKIEKSGWYQIDCQGFYNDKDGERSPYAKLYAKFEGADKEQTTKWASTYLLPKSYGEETKRLASFKNTLNSQTFTTFTSNGKTILANDFNDSKISNKIEAGVAFYSLLYPNTIMVYINFTEGNDTEGKPITKDLELGIEIGDEVGTNGMDDDDYIYVDDFRLKYLGESFALNENWTDFKNGDPDVTSDYESDYSRHVMILKRDLATDKWNSICLPVDLTKEQLHAAFSSSVMLAKMTDPKDANEGCIAFKLINIDNPDNAPEAEKESNPIVVRRGECYLIKPGVGNYMTSGNITIGDVGHTTVPAPYYVIPRVSLNKQEIVEGTDKIKDEFKWEGREFFEGIGDGNAKRFHAFTYDEYGQYDRTTSYKVNGATFADCKLHIYATFENQRGTDFSVPANSYTFHNGDLYHLTSGYKQKGYSWWIEDSDQDENNPTATRHSLGFAAYMDGISDNTTVIEGITADITGRDRPMAVYNLQGQAVRRGTTSLAGLPNGMYIVNGRKVSVR